MEKDSVISAELLLEKIGSISGLTNKKMFGGHGLFHQGKMFGLIDSKGVAFLKADEELKTALVAKGAHQHSRMPYYSIPTTIWNDPKELTDWANRAIELSK